jgi:hypothetical protein
MLPKSRDLLADRFSQDDVAAAREDIDKRTSQLVSKGRWMVPGYQVRFIADLRHSDDNLLMQPSRRNSVTFRRFKRFERSFVSVEGLYKLHASLPNQPRMTCSEYDEE